MIFIIIITIIALQGKNKYKLVKSHQDSDFFSIVFGLLWCYDVWYCNH